MRIYFILLLAFLNGTSEQGARVLLSLYALKLGADPFAIGMLAATFSMCPVLLAVQAGRLADRFGVRWLLTFTACAASGGMLLPYFFPGFAAIFIAAAMIGLADAIYNVAAQNLMGLLSTPQDRARNFNNYSLAASAFCFAGPLFAGFAIDLSGHATACVYIALLTLVPAMLLIPWGGLLPAGAAQKAVASASFRALISDRGVVKVLVTSSLLGSGNNLYQFYLPVYANAIGLSASLIGIILAMSAGAMFVMRLVLPFLTRRFSVEALLTYAFCAGAISLLLIPFFESAPALGAISFVFGLSVGCGHPLMIMLMFTHAPKGRSGEALGLRMTVNHFTRIVLPVVFGGVASTVGVAPIFWINALMLGTGGVLSRPHSK